IADYAHYNTMGHLREQCRAEILRKAGLNDTKILIGVPTGRQGKSPLFDYHMQMLTKPGQCWVSNSIGQSPAKNRNVLIDQALQNNCSHIMLIDDDVYVPKNALLKLLSHDLDVVSGLYFHRNFPFKPLIFDYKDEKGKCLYRH